MKGTGTGSTKIKIREVEVIEKLGKEDAEQNSDYCGLGGSEK